MMLIWLADCSFAPHSQIGVYVIPHLCIVAGKAPTLVLSLLRLTQASQESVNLGGLVLSSLM